MNKRLGWLILIAALLYPLSTWLVLNYYPDDPAKMNWTVREVYNKKYIEQLLQQPEVERSAVLEKLGGPDITEAVKIDTDTYQLMFYRTKRAISDGITTKDECTPLLFKNQRLIAVDAAALQQFQHAVRSAS